MPALARTAEPDSRGGSVHGYAIARTLLFFTVSSVSQHSPPGTSSLKLLTSFEVDSVNRSAFHRQGLPEAWGPGVRRGVRAGGSPSPQERAWRGGRVTGCLPWGVAPGRVPAGPGRGVGCSSVSRSPCRPGRASCAGCR